MEIGILLGVLVVLGILLSGSVLAFAISREHMEKNENGNPQLFLSPGDSKGMTFVAQNGGGATSDITITASVVEGSEIIEIIDSSNIYTVPAGGRVDINTLISIPGNARIGDSYTVALTFSTVSVGIGGGFAFGSGIQQKFNVVIGEEPAVVEEPEGVLQVVPEEEAPTPSIPIPKTNLVIIVIVVLIILIVIIYLIIRKRKIKEIEK